MRTTIALLFGVVAIAAGADTTDLDQDLAALYAAVLSGTGISAERALDLVDTALEFQPTSSDALFLRAQLRAGDQLKTQAVLADFASAIDYDTFQSVGRNRALVAYAGVLLRTRQPEAALAVLDDVDTAVPATNADIIADSLYLRARAGLAVFDGESARRAMSEGSRRFANDPRFTLLELLSEPAPSYRYRRELDRLIAAGADQVALTEALLRYALTAGVQSERDWAIGSYLDLGGSDPRVALAALGSDRFDAAALFADLDGYRRRDVALEFYTRVADGAVPGDAGAIAERVRTGAEGWSGYSYSDRDGDGFWEERFLIDGGLVESWERDTDQNGVIEFALTFAAGDPSVLTVAQEGATVSAVYGRYPHVESVRVVEPAGTRTYRLAPFTVLIRVLESVPPGGPRLLSDAKVAAAFTGVDMLAVERAAVGLELTGSSGGGTEYQTLSHGTVIRSRRDEDGDGSVDSLVVYQDGQPAGEVRDIDADGYFEVAIAYEKGVPVMRVIDEDDNRTPDLVEYLSDGGQRDWDLDQDGAVDVREFGILTNSVTREFPFLERGR